ncbi:MAG: archaeal heat shock protein Hsp20 [Candidatus Geothermarchaeales archaeon]
MSFWWRRKRHPWWEKFFRDLEEAMGEARRGTMKKSKPRVYGFTFSLGPDGKPVFREFGDVKPGAARVKIIEEREPLIDIFEENDQVVVLAEVPGVEKEDIELNVAEDALEIRVDSDKRKYYREVKLPRPVSTGEAQTTYKNGVLEVRLKKARRGDGGPSRSNPLVGEDA